MSTVKLVYVGNKFYYDSGTRLGVLYTEEHWHREDWGFVSGHLSRGETVIIRPATEAEELRMYRMLTQYKIERAERDAVGKDGGR